MGALTVTFTVAEAAKLIGVSRAHLYKFVSSGELRTVKMGDRRLVLLKDIDDFLLLLRAKTEANV